MFLGKHFCKLDNENRIIAPAVFLNHLTARVYITQGFDHNLWVLSENEFQEVYKKLGALNISDPMARRLLRLILGAAVEAGTPDKGHLAIPDSLRDYAQIKNEAFLIGQGDYFEIWSPELWDRQETELRDTESNVERFSAFEITTR